MKKIIIIVTIIFSFISYSNEESLKQCNIFKDDEKDYIQLYTGKTNLTIPDGKLECISDNYIGPFIQIDHARFIHEENPLYFDNVKIKIEVKNSKIEHLEIEDNKDKSLIFSGNYKDNKFIGDVYISSSILTYGHYSMLIHYFEPNIVDKVIEYYDNQKVFRISKTKPKDIALFLFSSEMYTFYVDNYSIYDYKTGDKIYEDDISDGEGKLIEYDQSGNITTEYSIKNNKLNGIKSIYFNEKNRPDLKGFKAQEIYYEKGNEVKTITYFGELRIENDNINQTTTSYNKDNNIVMFEDNKTGESKRYFDNGILKVYKKKTSSIETLDRYYITGEIKYKQIKDDKNKTFDYTLYDKKGKILYETHFILNDKNAEIKYVKEIIDGNIILDTIKYSDKHYNDVISKSDLTY